MWTDGRTDRQTDIYDDVNSRFRNFGNALESTWCMYIDQFGTGCDIRTLLRFCWHFKL